MAKSPVEIWADGPVANPTQPNKQDIRDWALWMEGQVDPDASGTGVDFAADLTAHINDQDNPHHVTADQLGLGDVLNKLGDGGVDERIGVNVPLYSDRPGDSPNNFVDVLTSGDPIALPKIAIGAQASDENGRVRRLTGAGVVATRALYPLEPNKVYLVEFVVQRRVDTPDPSNDAVRCALAWYNQGQGVNSPAFSVVRDITTLVVGSGRVVVTALVARTAGENIDIVAPASARYARPYVQTYGTLTVTDVEVTRWVDITNASEYSPDLTALEGRVSSIESLDLGPRVDALEGQVTAPNSLRFATVGDLAAATVPVSADTVELLGHSSAGDLGAARYRRVASEPSHSLKVQSDDGAWWEISEPVIYVEMAGGGVSRSSDANTLAIQQLGAYLSALGGGVIRFRGGIYRAKSLTPYNYVEWWGEGKDKTVLMLDDGVNANFVMTQGFSSFADDVKRSYSYYATTAARNAAGASAGAYAMVASSNTDFNNASWYVAINTPAATDADWQACPPVVGCVSGGMRDLTIDGNAANQVGNFIGCAWYGINTTLYDCAFQNAATTLHGEVPGAVFSTVVGTNLQWSVRGVECRKFTVCGFLNNAQSDGAFYDVMVYADDTVTPTDCLIHHKSKASGQKWDGVHGWGGASATIGMICDNQTPIFTNTDMERPVIVNQGGFRFFGQVYRANDASRTDGPAFTFASGLASTQIRARVANFRYGIKHVTSGGNGLDITIIHTSADTANAAFRDPSGAGLTYNPNNEMLYLPTYSGGVSIHETPPITTRRLRGRNQSAAYAASFTPNLTNGDFIIVGQLTGNISIAPPTGSVSVGDEISFYFLQDATGGRTISWDPIYHGGPTASGTGNLRRLVKFIYTGAVWVLQSDTGAWIS